MVKKKEKMAVKMENLAVPEVHVGEDKKPSTNSQEEESILYENVAIPEYRPGRKKCCKKK